MTKIEAIIRPDKLEAVKSGLEDIGIRGITVMEVRGAGAQLGYVHRYRGAEYRMSLISKIKLELVVPDNMVEMAVDVVIHEGRTGEVGDGKIFLIPVSDAIRVRTGDRGDSALS
jgi:nitrogen regulatory protein P-II 1